MNRILIPLIAAGMLGGCGVFRPVGENIAEIQPRASQEEFDAWAMSMKGGNILETAANLNAWATANITYTPDGLIDYPKAARVTFKIRQGDCDDFAALYAEALMRNGSTGDVKIFCAYPPSKRGHAVALFRGNDGLDHHISNWPDVRGGVAPLADGRPDYPALAATLYPDWIRYRVYDADMNQIEDTWRPTTSTQGNIMYNPCPTDTHTERGTLIPPAF